MNFAKLIDMCRFLLSLVVLMGLALSSCDKFSSKKNYVLPPDFKYFFDYNNGSEWKYVLSSDTAVKETVKLSSHRQGKMIWDEITQEFFEYDLFSNIDSSFKLRAVAEDAINSSIYLLVRDTNYKTVAIWYYSGGKYSGLSGGSDSVTALNSYTVGTTTYSDVLEIIPAEKILYKKLYFAKHVGIIRKETLGGKIYLLKSYSLQ